MGLIDLLPQPLLEDITENRCVPIVGAGFSRNAKPDSGKKMPLWSDVAKHFSYQLGSDYTYLSPLDLRDRLNVIIVKAHIRIKAEGP